MQLGSTTNFLISIANVLGLPLGARLIKANKMGGRGATRSFPSARSSDLLEQLKGTRVYEYIMSVISLTTDDLCGFKKPLYYTTTKMQGPAIEKGLDLLTDAVVRWLPSICYDLLIDGFSVYTYRTIVSSSTVSFVLLPYKEPVSFYLSEVGTMNVYTQDGDLISNALLFINFHARFLSKSNNPEKGLFQIEPTGMQLSDFEATAMQLMQMQNSVATLRSQQRYIRFATVDTGMSKGDETQNLVDDVSEGLNANSQDFPFMEGTFDDRIPVFPTRGNLGKVVVESYAPQADTSLLDDVNGVKSELAGILRFPETYSNFKEALGGSATSMIRQDIRYCRMLDNVRSVVERTITDWVLGVPSLSGVEFKMNRLASPEDADSISSLNTNMQFVDSVMRALEDCTTVDQVSTTILSLKSLFDAPSESVDSFLDMIKDLYIERLSAGDSADGDGDGLDSLDSFGGDVPDVVAAPDDLPE